MMRKTSWTILMVVLLGVGAFWAGTAVFAKKETVQPDTLVVTMRNPLHQPNIKLIDRTLSDPNVVVTLYDKLDDLQAPKKGNVFNCPEDGGVVYDLKFLHGTQLVKAVQIDQAGCRTIRPLENGTPGEILALLSNADEYRALLAKSLGLSNL
ncbi:MAG: hypothetical protein ACXVOI_04260 [Tumebacillaceae bacterium]